MKLQIIETKKAIAKIAKIAKANNIAPADLKIGRTEDVNSQYEEVVFFDNGPSTNGEGGPSEKYRVGQVVESSLHKAGKRGKKSQMFGYFEYHT